MKKENVGITIVVISIILLSYLAYSLYQYHHKKHEIRLFGNVDIKEVSTSFRVSGRLKKLYFDEGDFVKEGQLLATLEDDTFSNEVEYNKATLSSVKSSLENAESKFKRTKNLYKNDSASKQEYDNDKFTFEKLKADFEAQKARLKIALTSLEDTNLYAPSDAYVMTRTFEKGSMIANNQTVYELSLVNQSYIRTYIDEKNLGKISNGQNVKIITDSGNEYDGTIGYISPKAEFTPKSVETESLRTDLVYRLRITVKNPNTNLKQGMPVTILVKI
jgi:HlyD family secretion protein